VQASLDEVAPAGAVAGSSRCSRSATGGLSYTDFSYSRLTVTPHASNGRKRIFPGDLES